MEIRLARISSARGGARTTPGNQLAQDFVMRAARYLPCVEQAFPTEAALLEWADKQSGRTRPFLLLLDPLGQALSSAQFAARLGALRDSGTQTAVLAIGPADGWTENARRRADLVVSFGPITLPHELARIVLAEQVYRSLTILAGHPYHCGH